MGRRRTEQITGHQHRGHGVRPVRYFWQVSWTSVPGLPPALEKPESAQRDLVKRS